MIQKIKDLMQIKEGVDDLKTNFAELNTVSQGMSASIQQLSGELAEVKTNQQAFLDQFGKDLKIISDLREDFKKEIYDFKLLKADIQKRIMDKFQEELDKELTAATEKLTNDAKEYEEVQKRVGTVVVRMERLSSELAKISDVASKIKAKDFEMERFAKQLLTLDKEKLELLKKIDSLERLCAKWRREKR